MKLKYNKKLYYSLLRSHTMHLNALRSDRKRICYIKDANLFLIFFGLIALMSGLPAYLNRNGTELLIG